MFTDHAVYCIEALRQCSRFRRLNHTVANNLIINIMPESEYNQYNVEVSLKV